MHYTFVATVIIIRISQQEGYMIVVVGLDLVSRGGFIYREAILLASSAHNTTGFS